MTKDTLVTVMVSILCSAHDGYRRADIGFKHGEQTVTVTHKQLAAIKADPRLKVLEEEPVIAAKAAGAPGPEPAAKAGKTVKTEAKA